MIPDSGRTFCCGMAICIIDMHMKCSWIAFKHLTEALQGYASIGS